MWRRIVGGVVAVAAAAGCESNPSFVNASSASNAKPASGFLLREAKLPDGSMRKYSVFVPRAYVPGKRWATVVFLQGIGEGGTDGRKQTTVGLGPYVRKHESTFGLIAVFPQSGGLWSSDDADAITMACLADVQRAYSVDARRVYLTGASTGGYGTWKIGATHAATFAALAPLCGRTGEAFADRLKTMPVWAFHNSLDPFVWSAATRDTVALINERGGHAKSTVYDAIGHDCWTRTYKDPAFWTWLLAQRKA